MSLLLLLCKFLIPFNLFDDCVCICLLFFSFLTVITESWKKTTTNILPTSTLIVLLVDDGESVFISSLSFIRFGYIVLINLVNQDSKNQPWIITVETW